MQGSGQPPRSMQGALARGPLQLLQEHRRARRLLAAALAGGSLLLVLRASVSKLVPLMLYHPVRYDEIPGHERRLEHFKGAFGQLSYAFEEVEYPAPASAASGQGASAQRAILLRPAGPPAGDFWLLFGGNAMVGSDWLEFCLELVEDLPAGSEGRPTFLLLDYPGYGANPGTPSPGSILAGQLAALRATLPRLGAPPARLNLLGHSLGAAAAAQLAVSLRREADSLGKAAAPAPGRLVLSAPFLSIGAMAQVLFGSYLLPSWLLRVLLAQRWSNAEWVPQAASAGWQVSILHGSRDEIVPTWMGRALREAVVAKGFQCGFAEVRNAGHNDLLGVATREYAAVMGLAAQKGQRGAAL